VIYGRERHSGYFYRSRQEKVMNKNEANKGLSPEVEEESYRYHWPGNIWGIEDAIDNAIKPGPGRKCLYPHIERWEVA